MGCENGFAERDAEECIVALDTDDLLGGHEATVKHAFLHASCFLRFLDHARIISNSMERGVKRSAIQSARRHFYNLQFVHLPPVEGDFAELDAVA